MKFLKGLALTLLSFLLFLSLSIFGTALMLDNTFLNPDFITAELNRLDVSSLMGEFVIIEVPPEAPHLAEVIDEAIADLEPLVKEQTSAAIYSIYDYLRGKSQSLDLALTLKDAFFNPDFVASMVDELDMPSLVVPFLSQQLTGQIPPEMEFLDAYLDEYLDDVVTELTPWLKEQISIAAGPYFDYLLGKSQTLNVVISLEPVMNSLKDTLREPFLESPPPELAVLPRSTLERYYDEYFEEAFAEAMPATFELNESVVGAEVPAQMAVALAEAEEGLAQAKQYVSYFQLGYKVLIAFMVLLTLGIILIKREVKGTTRELGIIFLTFGAIEYAGILVAKHFAGRQLPLPEIPPSLQTWLPQFFSNLLAPLEMFSLGLLIGGIALLIVSFVYKPRQPSS